MKIYNALLSVAYISCTIAMDPQHPDIILSTVDKKIAAIPYKYAQLAGMLRDIMQDVEVEKIPVPFTKETADYLMSYLCETYAAKRAKPHVKSCIYAQLKHSLKSMDTSKLYPLIRAIDYLNVALLMPVACIAWQEKSFTHDELDKLCINKSAFSLFMILPTMRDIYMPGLCRILLIMHISDSYSRKKTVLVKVLIILLQR